eukprot:m.1217519 g.1217519  ORF g.1217519 m.1217519 type:complete len:93 (+) comp24617_c1_seq37:2137-2415(+)
MQSLYLYPLTIYALCQTMQKTASCNTAVSNDTSTACNDTMCPSEADLCRTERNVCRYRIGIASRSKSLPAATPLTTVPQQRTTTHQSPHWRL